LKKVAALPILFLIGLLLLVSDGLVAYTSASSEIRFAILGDRTGEAVPGVYEEAWREANLDHPDFAVTIGDTIQGGNDLTMDAEWQQMMRVLEPYQQYRIFFTPGNHDIWSSRSAQAFEKYTKHPPHYSFDYKQAHFTVLDNSRSDEMPAAELAYLEKDLQLHGKQPVKFIFSHRPSWILHVVLGDSNFALHKLAKRYGVKYVIAGHLHQMLHFELDGITYLSVASSGGHLRNDKAYEKGWFFAHTLVTVRGDAAEFKIKELSAPFGKARATTPADWGVAGLISNVAAVK
jgi:UDP-2,3-diacylglucosamine pyrophosphatase LpxH